MAHVLVEFKEGKKKTSKYLFLSKDIKGYEITSGEDAIDREYMVKWQPSFHGDVEDPEAYDNGLWPGKILAVGATPEEVVAKAKERKIRIPANIKIKKESGSKKPMKKPLRKSSDTRSADAAQHQAKSKRMLSTMQMLTSSTSSKGSMDTFSSANDSTSPKKPAGDHREDKNSSEPDGSSNAPDRGGTKSNSKERVKSPAVSSTRSRTPLKAGDVIDRTLDPPCSKKRVRSDSKDRKKDKNSSEVTVSSNGSGRGGTVSDPKESVKSHKDTSTTSLGMKHESSGDFTEMENSEGAGSQSAGISSGSIDTADCTSPNGKNKTNSDKEGNSSSSESDDSSTSSDSEERRKSDFNKFLDGPKEKHGSENKLDPALPSPPRYLRDGKSFGKSGHASGSGSSSGSEDDDATFKLDKLKKEHANCGSTIKNLEEDVSRKQKVIDIYKQHLESRRAKIKALTAEVDKLQNSNQKLEQSYKSISEEVKHLREQMANLQRKKSPKVSDKIPLYSLSPSSLDLNDDLNLLLSPKSPVTSPQSSTHLSSPTFSHSGGVSSTIQGVKKSLFPDKEKAKPVHSTKSSGHSESEPLLVITKKTKKSSSSNKDSDKKDEKKSKIASRVEADLKGSKRLEVTGDKVYFGDGIYMNQKFWEERVRKQTDDPKFLKDCAQGIWGIEGLKKRTPEFPSKGKNPATPAKVHAVYDMLRGKLQARGLEKDAVELVVSTSAKTWLGQKMYDVGRPPKPKKLKV